MRLVGQLLSAATAFAAANANVGCDRHTRPTATALSAEADANARRCAQQVINLISLAFGTTPAPAVAAATAAPRPAS